MSGKLSAVLKTVTILALLIPVFSLSALAFDFDPSVELSVSEQHPDYAVLTVTAVDFGDNNYLKTVRLLQDGNIYNGNSGAAVFACLGESLCTKFWIIVSPEASSHTYKAQAQDYHDSWFDSNSIAVEFKGVNEAPVWSAFSDSEIHDLTEPRPSETPGTTTVVDLNGKASDSLIATSDGKIQYSFVGVSPKDWLTCKMEGTKVSCAPVLYKTGDITVTVRASDGSKTSDASFVVNVQKVNNPPLVLKTSIDQFSMPANGENAAVDLSLIFKEPYGDALRYDMTTNNSNAFKDLGSSNFEKKTVRVDGKDETHDFLKLVGKNGAVGPVTVTLKAVSTSTSVESSTVSFTVVLTAVAQDPIYKTASPSTVNVEVGTTFQFNLQEQFDMGPSVTIKSYNLFPESYDNTVMKLTFDRTSGVASITGKTVGDHSWSVSITDSDGRTSGRKDLSLRIGAVNKAPKLNFSSVQNYVITRNSTIDTGINLKNLVTDEDDTDKSLHVWSCSVDKSDVTMSIDNSTKVLSLSTNTSFVGTAKISCTVKDRNLFGNIAKIASNDFNLVIARENSAPVVYAPFSLTSYVNRPFTYQIIAADPDRDDNRLMYSLVDTANFTLNASTGFLANYTPAVSGEVKTVKVQVCDSTTAKNKCTNATFTVNSVPESTSSLKGVRFDGSLQTDGSGTSFTNVMSSNVENSNLTGTWSVRGTSTVNSSLIADSIIEASTVTNSMVKNSFLNGCTVENSTVINYRATGSSCTIKNSFIDPQESSVIVNSLIEDSNVQESTLLDSTVKRSTVHNTRLESAVVEDNILKSGKMRSYDGTMYDASSGQRDISEITNRIPVAKATASKTSANVGDTITFDASTSTDSDIGGPLDDAIQSYSWSMGDGTVRSGKVVTHAYASSGSKSVTLTVTDKFGASNSVTLTISVAGDPSSGGSTGGGGGGGSGGGSDGGSGSGGGGSGGTAISISSDMVTIQRAFLNVPLRFTFENAQHTATVEKIENGLVTVTVASTPETKIIAEGGTVTFDVNDNGIGDLLVTVQRILSPSSVQLGFRKASEVVTPVIPQTPPVWDANFKSVTLKRGESGTVYLKNSVTLPQGVTLSKITGTIGDSSLVSLTLDETAGVATLVASNAKSGSTTLSLTAFGSNGKEASIVVTVTVSEPESSAFWKWLTGWFSADTEAPSIIVGLAVAQMIVILLLLGYLITRKFSQR